MGPVGLHSRPLPGLRHALGQTEILLFHLEERFVRRSDGVSFRIRQCGWRSDMQMGRHLKTRTRGEQ